jgi:glycosyltransferase involved in cell wall biosynthesis
MRVALLATTIDFGGIENVLLTLLRHADREIEFVPLLFTRSDAADRSFFDRIEAMGIRYRMIKVNHEGPKYFSPIRNFGETVAVLRRERIDAIHSHGYRADVIALAAARLLGLPVVATCHGFVRNDRRLTLYGRLDVFLLRYFQRVIAVSGRMRDDLIAQGLSPERVAVLQNAIELPCQSAVEAAGRDTRLRLGLRRDEFVFGYVGRLSPEKGVQHLIDAVRMQPGDEGPWRLLIVGDGPQRRELEASVSAAALGDRVTFAGFHAETSGWYAAMDAFVLPSLTEGTPLALLEAMAHRVPVVASAVGGVPAIVSDHINGLLVPPADAAALAAALREVAGGDDLRRELADAAYETVKNGFDARTWVAGVRGVYEEAIREHVTP